MCNIYVFFKIFKIKVISFTFFSEYGTEAWKRRKLNNTRAG